MLLMSMQWFGETGFLLPNWAWVAIAAVVLALVILIIVLALKGKRRKNAEEKNEALSKTIYNEQQPQPVREEQPERKEEGPAKLTPVEEPKPVEQKAVKPAQKPAAKKTTARKTATGSTAKPAAKAAHRSAEKDDGKVYHISRRKDENKWQIKAEGGAKAIRLFNTQAEAIEYAKQLADNQDARIMIHKADGSFRRLDYKN